MQKLEKEDQKRCSASGPQRVMYRMLAGRSDYRLSPLSRSARGNVGVCGRGRALECDGLPRPTWSSESAAVNKNRTTDRPSAHSTSTQAPRPPGVEGGVVRLRAEGGVVLAGEGRLHARSPGTAHSQRTWGRPALVTAPQGESNCQKHEKMRVEEGPSTRPFWLARRSPRGAHRELIGRKSWVHWRWCGRGTARREASPLGKCSNGLQVGSRPSMSEPNRILEARPRGRPEDGLLGPYGLLHA